MKGAMEVEASLCLGTLGVATNGVTPSRKKKEVRHWSVSKTVGYWGRAQCAVRQCASSRGKPTNIYTVWYFCYQRNVVEYILLKITEKVILVDTYYISTNWRTAVLFENTSCSWAPWWSFGCGFRWCKWRRWRVPVAGACGAPGDWKFHAGRVEATSCQSPAEVQAHWSLQLPAFAGRFFIAWAGICFCYQLHRPILPLPWNTP